MATLPGFGQFRPSVPRPPSLPYTQEQIAASLAANPNAAGMPGGSAPYFQGGYTSTMPASPSGGGGGQSQQFAPPDYASLIANDPVYLQLQQSLSANGIANAAQRAAATQRALIGFGLVPDFNASATSMGLTPQALNFLSQDITPDITTLANQNTQNGLSTEARLNQAHSKAVMQLRNALAARGALSSGEANYQLNNQEQSYQQSQQDLLGKLLDAITGYQNQYLTGQQQAQSQLGQGLADAYARQLQMFMQGGGYSGGGQTPAAPPPAAPPPLAQPPQQNIGGRGAQFTTGAYGAPAAISTAPPTSSASQAGRLARIDSLM